MKILAIDDHELFRIGLKYLLKCIDENVISEEAGTVEEPSMANSKFKRRSAFEINHCSGITTNSCRT